MSYSYRVKSTRTGNWEPWTGTFKTEEDAKRWHDRYGNFHKQRGYELALFFEGEMVKL